VKDGIEDHSNTGAGKSLATGRHLIQDRPERKEVGAGIDVLADRAEQSDTPRRAGGLMSGAASKAVAQLV